jgi:rhodanese-related sulfurtransferase
VIVLCQEGYTSSLAADALQRLGVRHATDIIGGYAAWREAGLPVTSRLRVPV